jgi:hypothetical protein
MLKDGATHGIQWVDFDGDGALDFSFASAGARAPIAAGDGHQSERHLFPGRRRGENLCAGDKAGVGHAGVRQRESLV